jgi:tetratricopeptide (TPR) repeat protein
LHEAILRARYLRHEETVPSLETARAYCEEIVRQEPNCAAAYAELALTLFLLEKLGAERRETTEPKVRHAIECARRLDERASMTLACLAKQEYRYDWKWEQAERHFQQATEAGPNDADVFVEFSIMLAVLRRFDESLSHAGRACSLDSISPAARLQAGHANYAQRSMGSSGCPLPAASAVHTAPRIWSLGPGRFNHSGRKAGTRPCGVDGRVGDARGRVQSSAAHLSLSDPGTSQSAQFEPATCAGKRPSYE